MSRKLTLLSLKQKLEILNQLKNKFKTTKDLAKEYKCDVSTIRRICRDEENIREKAKKTQNVVRKRFRKSAYENLDLALYKWFINARAQNATITGPILMEMLKKIAVKLNIDFEPNRGWLWRWQKRYNIVFKKSHGEQNDADQSGAQEYIKNVLPSILQQFKPDDVFNADESALFYKALPNGTYAEKSEDVKGNKAQKARLTLLFLCNATGNYKKNFVIGKSKHPRCFTNKQIPIPYYSNQNAWMTWEIWTSIMLEFDKEMGKANRKVLLFVDNSSCHKVPITLENVKIEFLPPNTTSLIQPLDQGIIHCFKAYYRQTIVRKQVLSIEKGQSTKEFLKSVTLLDALYFIKRSWFLVKEESIKNCFLKAGFILEQNVDNQETNGEYQENEMDQQTEMEDVQHVFGEEFNFNNYILCDENVQCYGVQTDDDIINEVLNENPESVNCEDDNYNEGESNITLKTPTLKEALESLDIIKRFFIDKNFDIEEIENIESKVFKILTTNSVQKKMTDYFK